MLLLQRIGCNTAFILVAIHCIGMVFKTDTIPILIDDFTCIIHIGIFVDHNRRGFQHIDEEDTKKDTNQKGQQLQMIKKLHDPY